jgi:Zn-dependent protease
MTESITLSQGLFPILIALFSIIAHEVAHGYAAYIQGDETAYRAGRLTLNPIPHIDMVGSILVPFMAFITAGMFFGWAKPVPYNVHNVRGKYGEAFVASAGVLTNFALAFCAALVFVLLNKEGLISTPLAQALFTIIVVNVSLGVFNLIPVPPFDGMAIIQALFPKMYLNSRVFFNPLYLVGAILLASFVYGQIAPSIFTFIFKLIS